MISFSEDIKGLIQPNSIHFLSTGYTDLSTRHTLDSLKIRFRTDSFSRRLKKKGSKLKQVSGIIVLANQHALPWARIIIFRSKTNSSIFRQCRFHQLGAFHCCDNTSKTLFPAQAFNLSVSASV